MTLRLKAWLLAGAALVGLVVVTYFAVSPVLQDGFAEVEAENTRQNVRRALEAVSEKIAGLDKSPTTTPAGAAPSPSLKIETRTLSTPTSSTDFRNNELSLVMFVNLDGEVVFARPTTCMAKSRSRRDCSTSYRRWTAGAAIMDSSVAGCCCCPTARALASRPILTSEHEGRSMAR
jgi:hypothetical protein